MPRKRVYTEVGPATTEEFLQATKELIALWDEQMTMRIAHRKVRHLKLLHGLIGHCMNISRAATILIEQGMASEAAPLVRVALEHAATTQWIVAERDRVDGFAQHAIFKGGRFHEVTELVGIDVPDDIRDFFRMATMPKGPRALTEIRKMFKDLDPSEALYMQYLYLCGSVHPSATTTVRYLDLNQDPPGLLRKSAELPGPMSLALAMSACCAMAVYTDLIVGKPHKAAINRIADRISVPQWFTHDGKPPKNRL